MAKKPATTHASKVLAVLDNPTATDAIREAVKQLAEESNPVKVMEWLKAKYPKVDWKESTVKQFTSKERTAQGFSTPRKGSGKAKTGKATATNFLDMLKQVQQRQTEAEGLVKQSRMTPNELGTFLEELKNYGSLDELVEVLETLDDKP